MGWQTLIEPERDVLYPWVGGRILALQGRTWQIQGRLPPEFGWYTFKVGSGRSARVAGPADPDMANTHAIRKATGYLVGDRLIPDDARVEPDPERLLDQTFPVYLVEPGQPRFSRVEVLTPGGAAIFFQQLFPQGPEAEVEMAWQDRKASLDHIKGVPPALDLAFRWLTKQRADAEVRAEQNRLRREAEARRQEAMRSIGSAAGRRTLAATDFRTAAQAALRMTGAELLDCRPSYNPDEMVVQYRYQHRRLECVVEKDTLRVVESGVCLTEHGTGRKGDRELTLEALPSVIGEAIQTHRLVVYRHAPGDQDFHEEHWDDDDV